MNFRTTFKIDPSDRKINYGTASMFLGSCFASEIGMKMSEGKLPVEINPSGTVYNPSSVCNTLELILGNRKIDKEDLHRYNDIYISFLHDTTFSSEDPGEVVERINSATERAYMFLKEAGFLFITFGTARVYRFNDSGMIVSNCHKIPDREFTRELLTVDSILAEWFSIMDRLKTFNPRLRVDFTISPVRHWKDGAHGNQISKSVLMLATEKLLEHQAAGRYFPAYELLMDDLRDYRFYSDDMLHPSEAAVDYIWKAFSDCYMDPDALILYHEVAGITKSLKHRFITDSLSHRKEFAERMLEKINVVLKKSGHLDFSDERSVLQDIISRSST